jgi:ring-1,2-phenylacetyl-CoA epoxidase subunit PaaD
MKMNHFDKKKIIDLLKEVVDPEIPTISLIDLGVITNINFDDNHHLTVKMTPTFTGCPAMDYMKNNVEEVLQENGISDFTVEMNLDSQWTSNNITADGLKAIAKHGLAPPPRHKLIVDIDILKKAVCPFCGSDNTELKSPFGPTLCRSLHYCHACSQGFEQFKPV